jgi:hypothetical protein
MELLKNQALKSRPDDTRHKTSAEGQNQSGHESVLVTTYRKRFDEYRRTKDSLLREQLLRMRKQIEYKKIISRIKELVIISSIDDVEGEISRLIRRSQKVKYSAPAVFFNDLIKEKITQAIPEHSGERVLAVRKRKGLQHEFVAVLANDYLPDPLVVNVRYALHGVGETLIVYMDNLTQQQMPVRVLEM